MNGLPLHPAIVHLPLGLALVIPLAAALVVWLAWRRPLTSTGRLARGPLTALIVAQAMLVGGGLLAEQAGEADEDRVEAVVPEAALETHEHGAERFVLAGALTLGGLAAAWLLATRPKFARPVLTTAALGTVAVLALGLAVGHSGGALVYQHGAASAHVQTATGGTSAPALPARGHDDDD